MIDFELNKTIFEAELNELPMPEESFIIGGVFRQQYFYRGEYGSALRKYDPIAFRIGFREWLLNHGM